MQKKGIETGMRMITTIVIALIFLIAVGASPLLRSKLGEAVNMFREWLNLKSSGNDKVAEDSVKALACAIDITAKYGAIGLPAGGIDFSKIESCRESGEIVAPSAFVLPDTIQSDSSETVASKEIVQPKGTNVLCGKESYYLSASEITASSAKITIADANNKIQSKTLQPYDSCTETNKNNCFLYSEDYSESRKTGIKTNIISISKTNSVMVRSLCPAEDKETKDSILTANLLKNSATHAGNPGFSTAILNVVDSFGDRITGRAVSDTPNKKCFGGEEKCVECNTDDSGKFFCTVTAFELPQKIGSGAQNYALAWVGLIGEPYYLVYYETFPKEAAAAWGYNTFDIAWTAVAIGGITNIGGVGKIGKAVWAGAKAVEVGSVNVMAVSIVRGELKIAFKEALTSKAAMAFNERLMLEYGEKRALQHVIAAESASAIMGVGTLKEIGDMAVKNSIYLRMVNTANSAGAHVFEKLNSGRWERDVLLKEFHALATGTKEIGEKDIDNVIEQLRWGPADATTDSIIKTIESEKSGLVSDLNSIKKSYGDETLMTASEKDALKANVKKYMSDDAKTEVELTSGEFALKSSALKEYATKTATAAFGKEGKMALKKDLPPKIAAEMQKNADEIAEMTYVRLLGTIDRMPGVDESLKRDLIKSYVSEMSAKGIDNGLVDESLKDATRLLPHADEVYAAIKPTGKKLALTDKTKAYLMGFSIGAAYVGMSEHILDKYETTCGAGNLCLHTPSILQKTIGDSRNYSAYGNYKNISLDNDQYPNYDGLVMLKFQEQIPLFEGTRRFNLASPCKTDLKITFEKDTPCVNYASKNTVVLEAKSGGCCQSVNKFSISCQRYVKDNSACSDYTPFCGTGDCIITERFSNIPNDIDSIKSKTNELMATNKYASVSIVNSRQNVKTLNSETITNCDQPFGHTLPFTYGADKTYKKYIAVSPDTDSMKKYTETDGFGENFCFENPKKIEKYAQDGCIIATLAVSAAAASAVTGATGGAGILAVPAITAAIGGGGALCEHTFSTMSRWPFNQY